MKPRAVLRCSHEQKVWACDACAHVPGFGAVTVLRRGAQDLDELLDHMMAAVKSQKEAADERVLRWQGEAQRQQVLLRECGASDLLDRAEATLVRAGVSIRAPCRLRAASFAVAPCHDAAAAARRATMRDSSRPC